MTLKIKRPRRKPGPKSQRDRNIAGAAAVLADALTRHGHKEPFLRDTMHSRDWRDLALRDVWSAAKEALRLLEAGVAAGVAVGEGIRVKQ
jgi:hypothetical protein